MKKYSLLFSFIAISLCAFAQQPRKVTRTWFANPDVRIETPAFTGGGYYTSYKTMMKYLHNEVESNPGLMKMELVGKSQKGKAIPLITISNNKQSAEKLRILYIGCLHGNEHAGTEGLMWYIHNLAKDRELNSLLERCDFYIMPMVNIDGSEADMRYANNGIDLNRDQTRLSTVESQTLHTVAARVKPHVFIDFHEYKPLRANYDEISDRIISNANDFMFLYSSNPNVYPGLTKLVEEKFIPNAKSMAKTWGLKNAIYFTTKTEGGRVVMNVGGHSTRSSSNIMALRGCVSMLMEIRGVGLGGSSYLRRVNTVYQLARSYAQTAYDNANELKQTVENAAMQNRPIVTAYRVPVTKCYPCDFIDLLKNKQLTIPVDAHVAKHMEVIKEVVRPKAYIIGGDEKKAIELIDKFGINYEIIKKATALQVEIYTVKSQRTQKTEILNMHPVSVKTAVADATIRVPAGSIVIPMNQPLSTLAGILLEPECANGFVNFHVIDTGVGEMLPIYRVK